MQSLESVVEGYLQFAVHEQGVAKTTFKSYHAYIGKFIRYLVENGYPAPQLSDFNDLTVRTYYYAVSSKGCRPRTLYTTMVPLRSFGQYCVSHNLLANNPGLAVKLPKKDAAIRRETSEEECQVLMEAVERQRSPTKIAFQRAVLAVLIYTGLRRAEVCDLYLSDISLSENTLLVRSGKGSKSRRVPLCQEAVNAIRAWISVRNPKTTSPYLFVQGLTRRLYFVGIRSVVEGVKAIAGYADRPHISPHSIRHTMASRLMRQGASLHEVMTWLGHTQISTTQAYLHVSEEDLRGIAHLASPVARINVEPGAQGVVQSIKRFSVRRAIR